MSATAKKAVHTEGPWSYENGDDVVYGDGGDVIAEIPAHRTNEDWRDDALLIAAAPELLAAAKLVKDALEMWDADGELNFTQTVRALRAVRAAIVKAEGSL